MVQLDDDVRSGVIAGYAYGQVPALTHAVFEYFVAVPENYFAGSLLFPACEGNPAPISKHTGSV